MQFRKVTQIPESHCGPAVLEMLLDAIGIERTQEEITEAAEVWHTIEEHGMRIDQIALACARLAPQAQFWYKYHSSIEDIQYLLSKGYAVAVEWQGLFYQSEEEELEDIGEEKFDFGHYSIVSHYDDELQQLIIVDPYKDFAQQDRIIPVSFFLRRWWDTNEVHDKSFNYPRMVTDEQLLFFVTPKNEYFPREMGFKAYSVVEPEQ